MTLVATAIKNPEGKRRDEMRLSLAPTSALTDARGHNEKARSLSAWLRQAIRAVVSLSDQATGAGVEALTPLTTPTHPVSGRHRSEQDHCRATAPVNQGTGLAMSVTSQETQVRIISALTEGCSIRATERLTGAHRDTVMRP
jgi:hypothetical protein